MILLYEKGFINPDGNLQSTQCIYKVIKIIHTFSNE